MIVEINMFVKNVCMILEFIWLCILSILYYLFGPAFELAKMYNNIEINVYHCLYSKDIFCHKEYLITL